MRFNMTTIQMFQEHYAVHDIFHGKINAGMYCLETWCVLVHLMITHSLSHILHFCSTTIPLLATFGTKFFSFKIKTTCSTVYIRRILLHFVRYMVHWRAPGRLMLFCGHPVFHLTNIHKILFH